MSADVYTDTGRFAMMPLWLIDAPISDRAVRLYGVLRGYADNRTGEAHPSRATLASRIHCKDLKAVDAPLAQLVALGALVIIPRWRSHDDDTVTFAKDATHRTRTSNGYRVLSVPTGGVGVTDGQGVGVTDGQELEPLELELLPQPPAAPKTTEPDGFSEAYDAYPRKKNRADAAKAYRSALKITNAKTILESVREHAMTTWWGKDQQFIPYPASWLRARGWENEPEIPGSGAASRGARPIAPDAPLTAAQVNELLGGPDRWGPNTSHMPREITDEAEQDAWIANQWTQRGQQRTAQARQVLAQRTGTKVPA